MGLEFDEFALVKGLSVGSDWRMLWRTYANRPGFCHWPGGLSQTRSSRNFDFMAKLKECE